MADPIASQIMRELRAPPAGVAPAALMLRAASAIESLNRAPPPPDNTVRNLMAGEALRNMRDDRERALARSDMQDDDEFIRILTANGQPQVARLISLTARYAGELQHNLIHPQKRYQMKEAKTTIVDQNWAAIKMGGTKWHELVDPGLSGNARIACQNIADALPRLRGLTVEHVLNQDDDPLPLDYFCAAVAARWRANMVFAAGPYKTGNEQNAVLHALHDAVRLCRDYVIEDSKLKRAERPKAPTSIAEIQGSSRCTYAPFSRANHLGFIT